MFFYFFRAKEFNYSTYKTHVLLSVDSTKEEKIKAFGLSRFHTNMLPKLIYYLETSRLALFLHLINSAFWDLQTWN